MVCGGMCAYVCVVNGVCGVFYVRYGVCVVDGVWEYMYVCMWGEWCVCVCVVHGVWEYACACSEWCMWCVYFMCVCMSGEWGVCVCVVYGV